jgi:hypothetical protein
MYRITDFFRHPKIWHAFLPVFLLKLFLVSEFNPFASVLIPQVYSTFRQVPRPYDYAVQAVAVSAGLALFMHSANRFQYAQKYALDVTVCPFLIISLCSFVISHFSCIHSLPFLH